jgi:hypothetical protein
MLPSNKNILGYNKPRFIVWATLIEHLDVIRTIFLVKSCTIDAPKD